ncbi:MAG: hypothetical protein H5T83_13390, partial [Actinotalea sp.]|nr:hypothetical protein [Actinotalea sp.]
MGATANRCPIGGAQLAWPCSSSTEGEPDVTPGLPSPGPAPRAARPSPGRDVVVGVDLGTTSTKAVAFEAGRVVAAASHGYPLDEPEPGHAVQDSELILDAVRAAIRDVVAQVGADRVAGLSFSAAMHSLLGLGEHDEPLTTVVTWADTRAAEQA